jgi:coenzyme F420 biosynthesis associated uncharacterized protein
MTTIDPVDWGLAERVAARVAARHPRTTGASLPTPAQVAELVGRAESLVSAETLLVSSGGPVRAAVVDREEWTRRNVASYRQLLRPLIERFHKRTASDGRSRGAGLALDVTRRIAGVELGMLLGWMSGRVLGQYDLFGERDDHDVVYLVGPNLVATEQRFGFSGDEFRMWVTLHEVTHRAQFTGVPWLRGYFLEQVQLALTLADPEPLDVLRRATASLTDREGTRERLRDGGLPALLANDDQHAALVRLGGLMALLEGHGDVTMDRAAAGHVPSAARFSRVLHARRSRPNVLARLLGLGAKLEQYAAGERFIAEIERVNGRRAIDRCWSGSASLPTLHEVREPQRWLDRMSAVAAPGSAFGMAIT